MKNLKLLRFAATALLMAAAITLSGCLPLGFGVTACVGLWNSGGGACVNTTNEYAFTEELANYSSCEFVDETLGIGIKIYDGKSYATSCYWGYLTLYGEVRHAVFDVYANGKTYIYFSEDERAGAFDVSVATVRLAFKKGEIVCKEVEYNKFNLDLEFSNLKMKHVALEESDFLPHDGSLAKNIADENQVLQLARYNRNMYYLGKARTVEGGEIKTYAVNLMFLEENVFEIRNVKTGKIISFGTYKIIDDKTVTLKFGSEDNLFGVKPFETYPYLTLSATFYVGVLGGVA